MKKPVNLICLGAAALLSAGLVLNGCKSAPELTQDQAQALIQAEYDHRTPVGASVTVDDLGLRQGFTAKYWTKTKDYPNRYWADFTLTDEGKKAVKLMDGGSGFQWRPDSAEDKNYTVVVQTVVANPLKARDVREIQDQIVPGIATAKGASFTESVNLDGVPAPLAEIAHNPGNQLSTERHAVFSLENGAWKLHSIE
jgi:hypothetical protein